MLTSKPNYFFHHAVQAQHEKCSTTHECNSAHSPYVSETSSEITEWGGEKVKRSSVATQLTCEQGVAGGFCARRDDGSSD